MTEEPSMKATLASLIQRCFPKAIAGADWIIQSFQGKQDLERRFVQRLATWGYGDPKFIVLRDADSGDCYAIKANLVALAEPSAIDVTVRIVCKELESWFLGDLDAVKAAYPSVHVRTGQAKFRDPDRLVNASEELGQITADYTKINRAERIAAHLVAESNRSRSFRLMFATLEKHLGTFRG